MNSNENNGSRIAQVNSEEFVEEPRPQPPLPMEPALVEDRTDAQQPTGHATREGSNGKSGIEKSKLIMLGGGLLAAVLFLALTSMVHHSSATKKTAEKQPGNPTQQQTPTQSKGSVTPLMETVQTSAQENTSGQVHPGDIKRTGTPAPGAGDNLGAASPAKPRAGSAAGANTLGAIPSFSDTQQKWEEPQPYGDAGRASPVQMQQTQNALKEASLVFVRAPAQSQPSITGAHPMTDVAPMLEMTPGARIEAKLETQISSAVQAPVVAVVGDLRLHTAATMATMNYRDWIFTHAFSESSFKTYEKNGLTRRDTQVRPIWPLPNNGRGQAVSRPLLCNDTGLFFRPLPREGRGMSQKSRGLRGCWRGCWTISCSAFKGLRVLLLAISAHGFNGLRSKALLSRQRLEGSASINAHGVGRASGLTRNPRITRRTLLPKKPRLQSSD